MFEIFQNINQTHLCIDNIVFHSLMQIKTNTS